MLRIHPAPSLFINGVLNRCLVRCKWTTINENEFLREEGTSDIENIGSAASRRDVNNRRALKRIVPGFRTGIDTLTNWTGGKENAMGFAARNDDRYQ